MKKHLSVNAGNSQHDAASPARELAFIDQGVDDIATLLGSGPHGRIVLKDVESAKPGAAAAAAPAVAKPPAALPAGMADVPGHPFSADRLIHHMGQDKKAEGGKLTFVLVRAIGEAFVARDVDRQALHAFLVEDEGALA